MEKNEEDIICRSGFVRGDRSLSAKWGRSVLGNPLYTNYANECVWGIVFSPLRFGCRIPNTRLFRWGVADEQYGLMGDWLIDYDELIEKGWNACYEFYLSMKDFHVLESDRIVDQNVTL